MKYVMLFLLLGLLSFSCSSGDDAPELSELQEEDIENLIVGTWQLYSYKFFNKDGEEMTVLEPEELQCIYDRRATFLENGDYAILDFQYDSDTKECYPGIETGSGTWEYDGESDGVYTYRARWEYDSQSGVMDSNYWEIEWKPPYNEFMFIYYEDYDGTYTESYYRKLN